MDVTKDPGLHPLDLDLSVIIPVKNEEQNIDPLSREINSVMESLSYSWECIWIDDGSTDQTLAELKRLDIENDRHRFISFSRNYGQSAALYIGFCHARGKILVTLDGDGQNDPADIPMLVEQLINHGLDMVNGVRQKRQDNFIRKISSRIANGFRNKLTHEEVTDVGCSIRAFRRECVENIPPFKGMHRFLPTLVRIFGSPKIIEKPVRHRPRKSGTAKYGIQDRLWVGIWDTLAVRWMQKRIVVAKIKEMSVKDGRKKAHE